MKTSTELRYVNLRAVTTAFRGRAKSTQARDIRRAQRILNQLELEP
jgi:hypothetical protein